MMLIIKFNNGYVNQSLEIQFRRLDTGSYLWKLNNLSGYAVTIDNIIEDAKLAFEKDWEMKQRAVQESDLVLEMM